MSLPGQASGHLRSPGSHPRYGGRRQGIGDWISNEILSGWPQRAIIFLGNANCAISTEQCRSLLFKIDLKLGDLTMSVAIPYAQGGLFRDPFVQELGKFIQTFNSLGKAQVAFLHPGISPGLAEARGVWPAAPITQPLAEDMALRGGNTKTPQSLATFIPPEDTPAIEAREVDTTALATMEPVKVSVQPFPHQGLGADSRNSSTTGRSLQQTLGSFRQYRDST